MLSNELNDLEKKCIEIYCNNAEIEYDINRADPVSADMIKYFRNKMVETAYHEAGHLVTKMFTDLDFSGILFVSIIPDKTTTGRMVYRHSYPEQLIERMPVEIQRAHGYSLLLELFAGHASVMLMNRSEYTNLYDYLMEEEGYDEDDFDEEGTDLYRVERITKILSKPYFSKNRIWGMTANWTLEMLRIPVIWNAVEAVAEMLISKGEITTDGNGEVFFNIRKELNVPRVTKMPKWSRRIYGK